METNQNSESYLTNLSRFQLIPPEIRQMIYNFVWPDNLPGGHQVRIQLAPCDAHSDAQSSTCKLTYRHFDRQSQPAAEFFVVTGSEDHPILIIDDRDGTDAMVEDESAAMEDPSSLSVGLLSSCRSIYQETLLQFYARKEFVFVSTASVSRFLETVRPEAKAAIRRVELKHVTTEVTGPSTPRAKERKPDEDWSKVCKRMAQELTSLHSLHISELIQVGKGRLQIGESWYAQYMHFSPSKYTGKLSRVEVSVKRPYGRLLKPFYCNFPFRYAEFLESPSMEWEKRLKGPGCLPEKTADDAKDASSEQEGV